jgi:RNA polymerase sigma factor (sigma-70 family)
LSGFGRGEEHGVDMGAIARTDAQLVEASRRGEHEAFGDLVHRYQDIVCAISYSSTGNWALSEDVAQETFIVAWRQLGQLRETIRVRSWLCGIARNLARKARKRTDREQPVDDDVAVVDGNPFDRAAQAEVDRIVREALARIPETYRETLVLYYCENRSVAEVACALATSEAAVMQRLTRGRRYLAAGVTELVERSLRGSRPRRNLAPCVLAALPRVDLTPTPEGTTMLKIAIATTIATAAVATTAAVVHMLTGTSAAAPPGAMPSTTCASGARRPASASAPGQAPSPMLTGSAAGSGVARSEPSPRVIPEATIAQLALDHGPSRGPADAPVTIIVFEDAMCSHCSTAMGILDQLWEEYPGKLRLVVQPFPVHAEAQLAAEASLAADAQGKFWELDDLMIAHQDDLSHDALIAYARQAGLDVAKFTDALDHHTFASALARDIAAAREIGVEATPEFLIDGRDVQGARSIEEFRNAIDAALAERS